MLYEAEKGIIAIMKEIGAENDAIYGIITMLSNSVGRRTREECGEKLLKYFMAKGRYLTVQDALAKTMHICHERNQYLPHKMYVKYTGESTKELTFGKYYEVGVSYDNDRWFLIVSDSGDTAEYDAKLFEKSDICEIEYVGEEHEDGTITVTDGFEIGELYEVEAFRRGKYICKGGKECRFYEGSPTRFKKSPPPEVVPFRISDGALKLIRRTLEFGEYSELEDRLDPFCEFICQPSNTEHHDANSIIDYLKDTCNYQLENDIFLDCALATVTWSKEGNRFGAGSCCIVVYIDGKADMAVFVKEEKGIIKGIYMLTEDCDFELDEP